MAVTFDYDTLECCVVDIRHGPFVCCVHKFTLDHHVNKCIATDSNFFITWSFEINMLLGMTATTIFKKVAIVQERRSHWHNPPKRMSHTTSKQTTGNEFINVSDANECDLGDIKSS